MLREVNSFVSYPRLAMFGWSAQVLVRLEKFNVPSAGLKGASIGLMLLGAFLLFWTRKKTSVWTSRILVFNDG